MKDIIAGFPKTGTKSTNAALQELGYKVYSYLDHGYWHGEEWMQILSKGGDTELFRRMYENVDAVDDSPAFYFWKEIHQTFPDAKNAPPEKLLVFHVQEDWEPVCKFLGVEIPNSLFPHKNKKSSLLKDAAQNNFIMKQMIFETKVICFLIVIVVTTLLPLYVLLWQ